MCYYPIQEEILATWPSIETVTGVLIYEFLWMVAGSQALHRVQGL